MDIYPLVTINLAIERLWKRNKLDGETLIRFTERVYRDFDVKAECRAIVEENKALVSQARKDSRG